MNEFRYAILLLVCGATVAIADDSAVYESISDVAIGRVFLSPQQRQQLNVRRLHPERHESSEPAQQSEPQPAKVKTAPAGYIISNSGESRYWNNGDFVAGSSRYAATMRFPGDIVVVRHFAAEATDEETSGKSETERQVPAKPDAYENSSADGADEK